MIKPFFFVMVSYAYGKSTSPDLLHCDAAFGRARRSYALLALSPHVLIERVTGWRLRRAAVGGKVKANYRKLTPTGAQQAASSKSWVARQHQMFNFLALNY